MAVSNDAIGGQGSFSDPSVKNILLGGLSVALTRTIDKYVPGQPNQVKAVDARGDVQSAATPTAQPSAMDAFKGWISNPFVVAVGAAALVLLFVVATKD